MTIVAIIVAIMLAGLSAMWLIATGLSWLAINREYCPQHPEGHPFNWRIIWPGWYDRWLEKEYR